MAPPSTARSSSYMCGTLWLFFTLDSVQRHTRWAPSRGSIKTFRRLSLSPPLSSRINMCGGFFFSSSSPLVPSGGIVRFLFSFIHRGVKEEWKWNTSAPRLMSSPLVDILFFFGKCRISFFQIRWFFLLFMAFCIFSRHVTVSPPFFSFIGYPVCSNKHFQIIVTIKKKKERNFCERNGKETKKKFWRQEGGAAECQSVKTGPFYRLCGFYLFIYYLFSSPPFFCFVLFFHRCWFEALSV